MPTQDVRRKLTAILSADVKGYSRLMGEDEKGTVRTLNASKEVMTGRIQHHHGRLVDATGDNLMAEFASVVDAVECAVEIQKELKTRNADLPENRRMEFRIGINLGDVIEEEGRIYGDGVNIAARLESLSEAGGICISGTAFDQVRNKLDLGYEYLGEQTVKNIPLPIRVYKVLMQPEEAGKIFGERRAKPRQWQRVAIGSVGAVIVIITAVMIWKFYISPAPQPEVVSKEKISVPSPEKRSVTVPPSAEVAPKEKVAPPSPEKVSKPVTPPTPKFEVASKEKMAFPLPDKPSIAVLPFVNMSGDKEQEYFSDGLTEEIITALSKTPKLFVIARHSTFTYKGKPVKVRQVAEELGVQYVLEGSVRKSEDRVRITAQLIDALKGHHLWAERYDRTMKDILAIQDEITKKIVTALQVKLTEGEQARVYGKGTDNLEAYLKIMEANWLLLQSTKEGVIKARQCAEEAISLDPNYATAYTTQGLYHIMEIWLGLSKSPKESVTRAIELYQKAIALDSLLPHARIRLGYIYAAMIRQHDKGISEGEKALALAPNSADIVNLYAIILTYAGRWHEAIPLFREAIRLNPKPPNNYYRHFAVVLRETGQYDEAISLLKKAIEQEPNDSLGYLVLTTVYSYAGRQEEARAAAAEVLKLNPKFRIEQLPQGTHRDLSIVEHENEVLHKAGLK
jgi:TolB-like protein/class 3 adenylate cyclase/Tfp pilus assembly protein PilF